MSYGLAAGIHFCGCEEAVLVLDENRNRYFQLSPSCASALGALARGLSPGPDDLDRLIATGVIARQPEATRPITALRLAPVTRSALEQTGRPLAAAGGADRRVVRTVTEVGVALAGAWARLRMHAFSSVLRDLARSQRDAAAWPATPDDLIDLALTFEDARRRLPIPPLCLPDALALVDFLGRRRRRATLVIGVKLNPFAAHCWLQADDLLLNDTIDHARAFTPIWAA